MDLLIASLTESGTGAAKLALIRKIANGRELRECASEVVAALNARGYAGTAAKVAAYLCGLEKDPVYSFPPDGTVGTVNAGDETTEVPAETEDVHPRRRGRFQSRGD